MYIKETTIIDRSFGGKIVKKTRVCLVYDTEGERDRARAIRQVRVRERSREHGYENHAHHNIDDLPMYVKGAVDEYIRNVKDFEF